MSKFALLSTKNNLDDVEKALDEYSNNPKYCFKICTNAKVIGEKLQINPYIYFSPCFLVVMEKLDDSITNEDRKDIVDLKHAKCRANKLRVVKIINANNPAEEFDQINHTFKKRMAGKNSTVIVFKKDILEISSSVIYKKGDIVEPDSYDPNPDNVCSNGIHYFNTVRSAFFWRLVPFRWSGIWEHRRDSGELYWYGEYLNGLLHGKIISYHIGSFKGIKSEDIYKNGFSQERREWNSSGQKTGMWKEFYSNDKLKSTTFYSKDVKCGLSFEYREEDGSMYSKCFYLNGIEEGKCYLYYPEGITVLVYKSGEIVNIFEYDGNDEDN